MMSGLSGFDLQDDENNRLPKLVINELRTEIARLTEALDLIGVITDRADGYKKPDGLRKLLDEIYELATKATNKPKESKDETKPIH